MFFTPLFFCLRKYQSRFSSVFFFFRLERPLKEIGEGESNLSTLSTNRQTKMDDAEPQALISLRPLHEGIEVQMMFLC